jgi:Fungal chitosanase of glycosyl hydrolase group 75
MRCLAALVAVCSLTGCVIDLSGLSGGGGGGTTTTSTVTAAELQALTATCKPYPGSSDFSPSAGKPATVPICSLKGAVWWTSAMSIACDGGKGAACKSEPGYSPNTAGTDSMGNPLDASTLPFVVVPQPSNGFDFMAAGLTFGSVAAVLYEGQLVYGIVGDTGDKGIAGEGSYALASALGIDPNPVTGGVSSGVTYLLFTGTGAVVAKNEDNAEAVTLGEQLAQMLVEDN